MCVQSELHHVGVGGNHSCSVARIGMNNISVVISTFITIISYARQFCLPFDKIPTVC